MKLNYERLSDYAGEPALQNFYLDSIYATLGNLESEYPGFRHWFADKLCPELRAGLRDILFYVIEDQIAAISILESPPKSGFRSKLDLSAEIASKLKPYYTAKYSSALFFRYRRKSLRFASKALFGVDSFLNLQKTKKKSALCEFWSHSSGTG